MCQYTVWGRGSPGFGPFVARLWALGSPWGPFVGTSGGVAGDG